MMHAPKAAASLSAGLLARKGGAQPAMRRQSIGLGPRPVPALDDLGWNDMGDDQAAPPAMPEPQPSPALERIETLTAHLAASLPVPSGEAPAAVAGPAPVTPETVKFETAAPLPIAAGLAAGRKSAFTLRLDTERHLRLRLLSAVTHRSSQALLIEALDALIATHPDVAALAADPKARRTIAEPEKD